MSDEDAEIEEFIARSLEQDAASAAVREDNAALSRFGTDLPTPKNKNGALPAAVVRYRKFLMGDALIIDRIAMGEPLKVICGEGGEMPPYKMVHKWIQENWYGFGDRFREADIWSANAIMDDALIIVDDDKLDPRDKKVRVDFRGKMAAVKNPDRYGQRTKVDISQTHNLQVNLAVELAKLTDEQLEALERFTQVTEQVKSLGTLPTIDLPFEEIVDEEE